MNFTEMTEAIQTAEALIRRAESYKNRMAQFLTGRLRGISPSVLKELKRELKKFNAQTGEWDQ